MNKIEFPEGAIKTRAELEDLVSLAQAGEKVFIYEAMCSEFYSPVVYQCELSKHTKIDKRLIWNVKCKGILGPVGTEPIQNIEIRNYNLLGSLHSEDDGYFMFSNYLLARAYWMRREKHYQERQNEKA